MTTDKLKDSPILVTMVMGVQCSYCGPMMQALIDLMKAGKIGKLEILNIEENIDFVRQQGVRSVPWLKIGDFELIGKQTIDEIEQWLKRATSAEGMRQYIAQMLTQGDIKTILALVGKQPKVLATILSLLNAGDAKINIRLGIGVIMETYAETKIFKPYIAQLGAYLKHKDARVRADACHYLSLTKDKQQYKAIEKLINDESAEVREIAQESLVALK
jgi:hypothetical protein